MTLSSKWTADRNLLKFLVALAKRYEYIYDGTDEADEIVNQTLGLRQDVKAVKKIIDKGGVDSLGPSAAALMGAGAAVGRVDRKVNRLIQLMEAKNIDEYRGKASASYIIETATLFSSWCRDVRQVHRQRLLDKFYSKLVAALVALPIEEVEEAYSADAVVVYAMYLNAMLERHRGDIDMSELLTAMLERAKTAALVSTLGGAKMSKPKPPGPRLIALQRYGLVPCRQGLTILELCKLYFGAAPCKTTTKSMDGFIKVATSMRLNVLVIRAISPNPVRFDISTLNNAPIAAPLVAPVHSGLSSKILTRFDTISRLSGGGKTFEYNLTAHECSKCTDWAVVRTIDGKTWDPLTRRRLDLKSANIDPDTLKVPRRIVKYLRRGPSPRVAIYNGARNDAFIKHLGIRKDYAAAVKRDNGPLIETLIFRIMGRVTDHVDKVLNPLPTNPIAMEAALNDPRFVAIMKEEILKTFGDCGADPKLGKEELVTTFISSVDGVIVPRFARELKINLIDHGPDLNIFREYEGKTLHTRLRMVFVDIIRRSIVGAIKDKENVYERLILKNTLLSSLRIESIGLRR